MSSHKKCISCIYIKPMSSAYTNARSIEGKLENAYCDYLCMTGKSRPCAAGKDCTAYKKIKKRKAKGKG